MEHTATLENTAPQDTCDVCGMSHLLDAGRRTRPTIAESPAMQALLKRAARFAASEAPIVIFGESGTGKEVVARIVHANGSRAQAPLVAVNVAALPAELLESELFGHAKGAFTGAERAKPGLFEEAHGGTLFLDEIAELPLLLQSKLLRALAEGEIRRVGETRSFSVDVRIVCATHGDLRALVRRGAFREDLYYRLKVLSLRVPPLRERREDILPLARSFLAGEACVAKDFAPEATQRLLEYGWPGNVRELANAVQHAAALVTGLLVRAEDLPDELFEVETAPAPTVASLRTLAEVEREHVLAVLERCGGSQVDAARVLGIARNTLWRKLRSYG
jgi:two-component system response regulator HydG